MRCRTAPLAVLAAGVLYTVYLQTLIPGEVFTSGDAGLKALITHQFAAGARHLDLRFAAEPWVAALWDEGGLYPFEPPNVVTREGRRFVVYSFVFPLLSAPFYARFGFRGLYLLPLVGTWAVWFVVWAACRRMDVAGEATAGALAVLVFASPLTFYSASFWEHAPAVALAACGVLLAVVRTPSRPLGRSAGFLAGFLVGSSALLREEHLVLAVLLVGWAFWARHPRRAHLVGGVLAGITFFAGVNAAAYGHPLGLHASEALATSHAAAARAAWAALGFLLPSLLEHFPSLVFVAAAVPLLARRTGDAERVAIHLITLAAVFCLVVPVLVRSGGGRQWGPRFLLSAVPLLCVAAAVALQAVIRQPRRALRVSGLGLFVAAAFWGGWVNAVEGTRYLWRNYQARVAPYARVRGSPVRYVAVSHQSVAQQLAGTMDEKTFFLARRGKDLRALGHALAGAGGSEFLYICYPQYPCGPFDAQPERYTFFVGAARFIEFTRLSGFERYLGYRATVRPVRRPDREDGEGLPIEGDDREGAGDSSRLGPVAEPDVAQSRDGA